MRKFVTTRGGNSHIEPLDDDARADWESAVSAYHAAMKAEQDFAERHREIRTAALAGKGFCPRWIDAEIWRLMCAADEARIVVLRMPAPDAAAFRWKLELVLRDEASALAPPFSHSYARPVLEDLDRLLGSAPPA